MSPTAPASAATAGSTTATAGSTTATSSIIVSGECERLARRFLCSVSYSGAVPPVTIRWYVNGGYFPAYDGKSFVSIGYQPNSTYDIRAVISDATGASADYHTS